jgi:hypothetical protein
MIKTLLIYIYIYIYVQVKMYYIIHCEKFSLLFTSSVCCTKTILIVFSIYSIGLNDLSYLCNLILHFLIFAIHVIKNHLISYLIYNYHIRHLEYIIHSRRPQHINVLSIQTTNSYYF